jgi:hypothetical protein
MAPASRVGMCFIVLAGAIGGRVGSAFARVIHVVAVEKLKVA